MSDHDADDRRLRQAFARFRSESAAEAPAADAGGVRRIARRRRTVRLAAMSAFAAVAIAAPLAAYGLARHEAGPVPDRLPAADRSSTGPTVEPSTGPSSQEPSTSTSPSTAPNRPVTEADIRAATALSLPSWGAGSYAGCPTGKVDMTRALGTQPNGLQVLIWAMMPVDADGDGDLELLLTLYCGPSIGDFLVVVVGRDGAGGLVTLGRVVTTGAREPIRWVVETAADNEGNIRLWVADRTLYVGADSRGAEMQWRTYRWNGSRFAQVAGPTSFTAAPPSTDLSVTVTPTTLSAPVNGVRRGSATVTVTNRGPAGAPGVVVEFEVARPYTSVPAQVSLTTGTAGCTASAVSGQGTDFAGQRLTCHVPALAAGANATFTFDVALPENNTPEGLASVATAKAEQPGIRTLPDRDEANNRATHPVTTS